MLKLKNWPPKTSFSPSGRGGGGGCKTQMVSPDISKCGGEAVHLPATAATCCSPPPILNNTPEGIPGRPELNPEPQGKAQQPGVEIQQGAQLSPDPYLPMAPGKHERPP
jgi:hypothetical protein